MVLIADGGSTRIDWCLLEGKEIKTKFSTSGINPVVMDTFGLARRVDETRQYIGEYVESVEKIHYYGAGCCGGDFDNAIRVALSNIFPNAHIEIASDILGVARALFGDNEGIACILGTGANSCHYDGKEIVEHVAPLGYILGDEGSGAVLGRHLLCDVFKNQLPDELCLRFREKFDLNLETVMRKVYKSPEPNKFLASLAPFLAEYIEEPSIHRLVLNSFKSFFVRNVARYKSHKSLPIGFAGSIAYYFRDVLGEAADAMDCTLGKIVKSPIDGLVEYHLR